MRRGWLASGLLALGVMTSVWAGHGETQRVDRSLAGWPVAEFSLRDHRGQAYTQDRLAGRWTLLVFGDTACAAPCAEALAALAGLYGRIGGSEALKSTQVLFVSLEPERDTPPRLRRYLASFDARFIGATGPQPVLRRLAEELGVTARPGPLAVGGQGQVPSIFLIGPDATVRAEFLPPFDVRLLTAAYLKARVRD